VWAVVLVWMDLEMTGLDPASDVTHVFDDGVVVGVGGSVVGTEAEVGISAGSSNPVIVRGSFSLTDSHMYKAYEASFRLAGTGPVPPARPVKRRASRRPASSVTIVSISAASNLTKVNSDGVTVTFVVDALVMIRPS